MVKRWDTFRIAKWGVPLGIICSIVRVIHEPGMPNSSDGYVRMLPYILGGAALFALVSGTRNSIPRAK
jgi:hypothetical protein